MCKASAWAECTDEILQFYGVGKLEEASSALANKLLRWLIKIKRSRS